MMPTRRLPRPLHTALPFLLAFAAVLALPAGAEEPTIGLDEIRPGMRGHGESVFVGSATERFEVEVLGVWRDVSPGTSFILARLTGRNLERTGVIAGMSGSPVWLDGRLAGAVAIGWSFPQEAIAGITPIATMRDIERAAPWGRAGGSPRVAFDQLLSRQLPSDLFQRLATPLLGSQVAGGRAGIALGAGGFSEPALGELTRRLPTFAPTPLGRAASGAATNAASGAAGAGPTDGEQADPLGNGASVAAVLIDGDFRIAATGTVTERSGDRVLAFGHSLFGQGETEMPMAAAEVITVLGSDLSSFKIANVGKTLGAFSRDHAAGSLGRIGAVAKTIPLTLEVASPRPQRFEVQLAPLPGFLGVLTAISAIGALDAATASGGAQAVDLELEAELGRHGRIGLRQSFEGDGAAMSAIFYALGMVDWIANNDLAEVAIERLTLRLAPYEKPRIDELVSAHALASRLAPGESTELVLELRGYRGESVLRRLPVTVPADAAEGRVVFVVGDGTSIDAARFGLEPPTPGTFEEARALLDGLGSARELALLTVLPGRTIVAGGETHPRLPPSMTALLAGRVSGRPIRAVIVGEERVTLERPLSGLLRVEVEVERPGAVKAEAAGGAGRVRPGA